MRIAILCLKVEQRQVCGQSVYVETFVTVSYSYTMNNSKLDYFYYTIIDVLLLGELITEVLWPVGK